MIKENLININNKLEEICRRIARDPKEITVIGVTKYSGVEAMREAVAAGLTHIGENRVQDAGPKFEALQKEGLSFTKHMIGHLQTNKAKSAVEMFDMIQSVDSLKLAREIDKQAGKLGKCMDILVQVNIAGETQKFGVDKDSGFELARDILALEHIRVQGLMTMAPFTDNKQVVRDCFKGLRLLRDRIQKDIGPRENMDMKYLSMGMSADYEIAVEEGANMIRVGTAIFK